MQTHGKLGKLAPKYDARTLTFETYSTHPTNIPLSLSWTYGSKKWPVWLNDRLSDCTIASQAAMIDVWSSRAKTPIVISDAAVLDAYKAVSGYDSNDPSTDRGATMLDALNHLRRHGVGGRKIAAYTSLEPGNTIHIREAIFTFGGVYAGLALPVSAQAQSKPGGSWSVVRGPDGEPASWGRHAVGIFGFNANVLTAITWGYPIYITWNFLHRYTDESFALVSEDFLNQAGVSPSGFKLSELLADLKEITG